MSAGDDGLEAEYVLSDASDSVCSSSLKKF